MNSNIISSPISIGEALDKLTILEIKKNIFKTIEGKMLKLNIICYMKN